MISSEKPSPAQIKLVIADVDGTLVTNAKVLTSRAIDVVRKLRQAGIKFVITRGKPPKSSTMLIKPLQLTDINTIGDMPNDVLIFEKSGISIAMGQASPEVQRAATYVTSSNEEDGFAKAMEQFVLASVSRQTSA